MLGANDIHVLAGKIESACHQGTGRRVPPLLLQLAMRLPALLASIGDSAKGDGHHAVRANWSSSGAVIGGILEGLGDHDLSVLDRIDASAGALRHAMGVDVFATFCDHVKSLRFDQARMLLDRHPTPVGDASYR